MIARVAVCLALMLALVAAGPLPPKWPTTYRVSGTFDIPYWNLVAPFELEVDTHRVAQRLSWYNGLDVAITDLGNQVSASIYPKVDTFQCDVASTSGMALSQVLPDLSTWTFSGMDRVEGWLVESWVKNITSFNFLQTYTFYVHREMATGAVRPIQYVLRGTDISLGSGHPDVYIWTFDGWAPNAVDGSVFNPPTPICSSANRVNPLVIAHRRNPKLVHASAMMSAAGLPVVDAEDEIEAAFHDHVLRFGKPILGRGMYEERLAAFRANHELVHSHNERFARGESTYSLALNHFADLTLAERVMLYSPRGRLNREGPRPATKVVKAPVSGNFSWVDQGAVNHVVDQAACGSCWAFGTAAALEGAYKLRYGSLLKLSEQQIVDCAWVGGAEGSNMGCNGGFAGPAYDWIRSNGGIALESSYPYLGQDAMCLNSTVDSGVKVASYVAVNGVEATIAELAKGPMAIAIDAAAPPGDFYFYRSGIYNNPQCRSDANSLDHEVTLVGYREYNGQMAAVLKNSWSTHWGDNGYGALMMDSNMCGWATQPRRPVVA